VVKPLKKKMVKILRLDSVETIGFLNVAVDFEQDVLCVGAA